MHALATNKYFVQKWVELSQNMSVAKYVTVETVECIQELLN